MRKSAIFSVFLTASVAMAPLQVASAQMVNPDMDASDSDMEADNTDAMPTSPDEMPAPASERVGDRPDASDVERESMTENPVNSQSPVPPAQPAAATPKVMDAARPEAPADPAAAEPAIAKSPNAAPMAAKDYPVCSKTVTDGCINPRAANGNPR